MFGKLNYHLVRRWGGSAVSVSAVALSFITVCVELNVMKTSERARRNCAAADHQEDTTWCPPQLQHEPEPLITSWAGYIIRSRFDEDYAKRGNIYLFLPVLNIRDNYDVSRVREETCLMKRGGSESEGNTDRPERREKRGRWCFSDILWRAEPRFSLRR